MERELLDYMLNEDRPDKQKVRAILASLDKLRQAMMKVRDEKKELREQLRNLYVG